MSVERILARQGVGVSTVSTWRKSPSGVGDHGEQTVKWSRVDSGIRLYIQLGSSVGVVQDPMGQVPEGRYPAYGPTAIGLAQGDGIQVDAAEDPTEIGRRFIVERGKDWGRRGGWQGEVSQTDEIFDDEEPES